MGLIYDVEIGYAFYIGNTQAWDTSTFQIEPGLSDEALDFELELLHKAQEQLYKEVEEQGNKIAIAGTWLHNYEENELSGKAECPRCHEYDTKTQIADHGVCYDCMQDNYQRGTNYPPGSGEYNDMMFGEEQDGFIEE